MAKIMQLETFTRMEKNSVREAVCVCWTTKNIASPNDRTTKPRSNSFRALIRNRRLTSFTVSLFWPDLVMNFAADTRALRLSGETSTHAGPTGTHSPGWYG